MSPLAGQFLLVEDNLADAAYIRELLAEDVPANTDLSEAESLAQATATLRSRPIDLVLLDLRLPDGEGVECVETIRSLSAEVPIIVLTGLEQDERLALSCIRAGAQDYLAKAEVRASSLRRAIAYARMRMEVRAAQQRADDLHRHLAAIVGASPDGIVSCRPDGRIVTWNSGAERVFRRSATDVIGRYVTELARAPDTSQPWISLPAQSQSEAEVELADGRRATLSVVATGLGANDEPAEDFALICRDVTEARQRDVELRERNAALQESERRFRALTRRLSEVIEAERAHISREVHDELGQLLTALDLHLARAGRHVATAALDPALAEAVTEPLRSAREITATTAGAVQRIALELRPTALDTLGLSPAIRDEALRFSARSEVHVDIEDVEDVRAPEQVATALFRVLQELLTNVSRHARARVVRIGLSEGVEGWSLSVLDDGAGIPAGTRPDPSSLGLLGMQERTSRLGGQFHVGPGPDGVGTLAAAHVPRGHGGGA